MPRYRFHLSSTPRHRPSRCHRCQSSLATRRCRSSRSRHQVRAFSVKLSQCEPAGQGAVQSFLCVDLGADGTSLLWLRNPEVESLGIVLVARRLPVQQVLAQSLCRGMGCMWDSVERMSTCTGNASCRSRRVHHPAAVWIAAAAPEQVSAGAFRDRCGGRFINALLELSCLQLARESRR